MRAVCDRLGRSLLTSYCDLFGSCKLACMSAAASGCLQLKILRCQQKERQQTVLGKCFCGSHESLFPIPLIESYCNVIRLYYGKTAHDVKGTCGVASLAPWR